MRSLREQFIEDHGIDLSIFGDPLRDEDILDEESIGLNEDLDYEEEQQPSRRKRIRKTDKT